MTDVKNIDYACDTAKEFIDLYYTRIDNSRSLTSKLYLDSGLLVWNGNGINGSEKIQKFFLELPASNHHVKTLDAQPIAVEGNSEKLTYLIQACGDVTFENKQPKKSFQQSFMICAVEGKWKIVTDTYRLQESYGK